MKLATIVSPVTKEALMRLLASNIPITAAWKLKKIVTEFDKNIHQYEEQRNDLVKKYATKNDDGSFVEGENGQINVDPKQMDSFVKDHLELLSVEVELPTVTIASLGDKLEVKTVDLFALDGIVVD